MSRVYPIEEQTVIPALRPVPVQKAHAKPIKVLDLNSCKTVVKHPYMTTLEYFLTEYARGLLVDMVRRPHIYRGVSFEKMYDAMAVQIINDNVIIEESPALAHACRAAGIPFNRGWIRTYIWHGTNVKTSRMKTQDRAPRPAPAHAITDPYGLRRGMERKNAEAAKTNEGRRPLRQAPSKVSKDSEYQA